MHTTTKEHTVTKTEVTVTATDCGQLLDALADAHDPYGTSAGALVGYLQRARTMAQQAKCGKVRLVLGRTHIGAMLVALSDQQDRYGSDNSDLVYRLQRQYATVA